MPRQKNPYMEVARQLKPILATAREQIGLSTDRGFRRRDSDGNVHVIGYRVKHVKADKVPDRVIGDPNAARTEDGKLDHTHIYQTNQYPTFAAVESPGTSKIEVVIQKFDKKGAPKGKATVVDTVIVGDASYVPPSEQEPVPA